MYHIAKVSIQPIYHDMMEGPSQLIYIILGDATDIICDDQ